MKRVLARVLVLGVASAVGLGLAEAVVRLAAPQVTMWPRYVTSTDYEIEMARNARIRHARGGHWEFIYTTNAIGRRGPYVAPEDARGRPTVVVLGDSFTFGIGVQDDEVYSALLRSGLGEPWVVVNAGMSGWGIDAHAKWYLTQGEAYDPDVVIVQFTANDPWDSDTGVVSIEDGSLVVHPYAGRKPAWQEWVSTSSLLQRSHLFSLVRALLSAPRQDGSVADPEAATAAERVRQEVQDRYVAYLRVLAERLADEGRTLLFVSVTHQADEGYVYDLQNYPVIQAEVRRLFDEGLLDFVELPMERMAEYPNSPEGHQWGSGHHRLVAEALTERIRTLAGGS